MARCDRCLASCDPFKLAQLLESYRINGIVDVCPVCRKELDDYKELLLDEIDAKMREKVAANKPAKRSIFSFLRVWS